MSTATVKFNYIARDKLGKVYRGSLQAPDERSVRMKLQELDFIPTQVKRAGREVSVGGKVKSGDVILFTERLSAMVHAGLPLIRCLQALAKQSENPVLRRVLTDIKLSLEGGTTFSDALARYPKIFSDFYLHLVRAGETGGLLAEVLRQISEYLDKEFELKQNVKRAFTYPTIVICVAILVVSFLVVFIVPVFAKTYAQMRLTLPLPTLLLVSISNWAIHYWWAVIGGGALTAWGLRTACGTKKGRWAWDSFKLKMPVFGDLNRKVAVARFIRTLGSLLKSGVSIVEAMRVVKETSGNKVIGFFIGKIERTVREGGRVADQMSQDVIFPPIVTQMVAAGEEAGALDSMLMKSADFLDREVDQVVKKLVAVIEPIMTLGLAVIVGFITLAIYLPMFDLIQNVAG